MNVIDYENEYGIMRRVKLPEDETDVSLGIPLDIYDILDVTLYESAPLSFRQALYRGLWIRGIILPTDLNKRNAIELVTQAYRAAIKYDVNIAMQSVKEYFK